jgi:uncharacterized protein
MSDRVFDPLRLDVQAFAESAKKIGGRWPIHGFERLVELVHGDVPVDDSRLVEWSAVGERRQTRSGDSEIWLHIEASTVLTLECQRCLQGVETQLDVERSFRFVAGEEAAAEIDAESDEDVLALVRALDLRELIEDELLLALPLVPRHESCALPLPAAAAATGIEDPGQARNHPFEALAALKRGGTLN